MTPIWIFLRGIFCRSHNAYARSKFSTKCSNTDGMCRKSRRNPWRFLPRELSLHWLRGSEEVKPWSRSWRRVDLRWEESTRMANFTLYHTLEEGKRIREGKHPQNQVALCETLYGQEWRKWKEKNSTNCHIKPYACLPRLVLKISSAQFFLIISFLCVESVIVCWYFVDGLNC